MCMREYTCVCVCVQRNIARKHNLNQSLMMMSESNEFREKAEEYHTQDSAGGLVSSRDFVYGSKVTIFMMN